MDSSGSSGRKTEYNGKEYDFVFDVDIEEGKPPLKLPYNLSENPYDAATKFLGANELPISYIDQVAKFIVTNTQGATIGQTAEAPSADPYGTESRYQPGQAEPAKKYLPHKEYLVLAQAKWEPVAKKLRSLNEKHVAAGNKHIALNPDGLNTLDTVLKATMGTPVQKTAPAALSDAQRSVSTIVTQWPYGDRLAALDALRCFVAWPGSATFNEARDGSVVEVALRGALDIQDPVAAGDASLADLINSVDATQLNVNNVMMALRIVTNLFTTPEGRSLVAKEADSLVALLARVAGVEGGEPIGPANNNLQIALTSAAFNFACLAFNEKDSVALELLMLVCQVAQAVIQKQSDPEVLFRALMTLGMVLAGGEEAKDLGKALEVGGEVGEAAKKNGEERIKVLARECLGYFKG